LSLRASCSFWSLPLSSSTNKHTPTMLSCKVVSGPKEEVPVPAGGPIQWVLANDGTVAWPEGTSLRLVGGPVLMTPYMHMPTVEPYQTVIVDMDVQAELETEAHVFYSLVTSAGEPFGEIMSVVVHPKTLPPTEKPVCVVAVSPMDGEEAGLEALQGEIKMVEFVVANLGNVAWPEDATVTLFYNTPGFAHLPTNIQIPIVEPSMTAIVQISVLLPDIEGTFKAMWAVNSPTQPDFGDILLVEFDVSDFPFMDWMLVAENSADSEPEVASQDDLQGSVPSMLSVEVAEQKHCLSGCGMVKYNSEDEDGVVSLGKVSGLDAGTPWALDLVLKNNGNTPWPANTALTCCFGDGFGCGSVAMECDVAAGEHVCLHIEMQAPMEASRTAWVMTNGDGYFGPLLMLEVQ